jgi:hypothetical protein
MQHIYSLHKQSKTQNKAMYSASVKSASANASISINITSDSIEECISALEKVVGRSLCCEAEVMYDAQEIPEERPSVHERPETEEKPKKNYVSGWLLFRRAHGQQAKKVLEKLHIVASGPNLVKVLGAMWAEIGEQQRAVYNEKAKAIRSEPAF